MNTQDRTKQQIKIKQLITYPPIAGGGVKLAALDENGVVYIYDDIKKEWIATNTSLKQPEKQEIEKLGNFGATNEAWLRLLTRKLDEVIEEVNKLLNN